MLQPHEKRKTATKTLSWIYHAKRQLSVGELVHALAIDCNEAIPTYEDVISEKTILDVCAGLVLIDAKNKTTRFVHHTLQEYFEASYQTWFRDEQRYITRACLIYLRLMSPERSLADSLSCYPFLKYAAEYWGAHARDEYHGELDNIALAAFRDISTLEKISSLMGNDQTARRTTRMFPCRNLAVQMSARFGALQVLKMLLRHQYSSEGTDPSGRTALHWAARGGFVDVVQTLLREGAEISPKTKTGMTPFHWAAKHGHERVIDELMPRINPAEATPDGRTALHWASSQGHISIVKKLLASNRVDCSGKRAVVMYGAKSGQNASSPPTVPRELSGGESSGHEEVTEFLLDSGANPNLGNEENQTALHWAAVSGNARIVSLILSKGAERRIQDIHGLTPWQFAVENRADETAINLLAPPSEWKQA
ncbi:ankyrin repeat-containing domain protein [Ustulina deusta]|nr:ankyrin repeat-containing domain protein [Ustulina deusta]